MVPSTIEVLLCSLGGILFISYLFYWFVLASYRSLKKCGIKGPKPQFFFGSYKERMKMNLVEHDNYLTKTYGKVSGFYVGRQPHILISDLDMIKQIMLKNFQNFPDHPPTPGIYITSDQKHTELPMAMGDAWSRMRRILSPSFSVFRLKAMLPLLSKSICSLIDCINEKIIPGESFNVFSAIGPFTIETVLISSFGYATDSRDDLRQLCKCVGILVRSISEGQIERDVLLYSNFPWLLPLKHVISKFSETSKSIAILETFALNLIKERRRTRHASEFKDVLQLMIEASDQSQTEKRMDDEEIVANILNFFITNYDALAIHLCYTIYLLALNSDIQEKLQLEIDKYFINKNDTALYDAAQEIEYLNNVTQESLRLYPPNFETDRTCKKTTVVGGVTIPEGAIIIIPIYTIHHNPSYWKDPEKFNPDRFKAEEREKQPQHCFLPFGLGPRTCIAMRFVQLVAKVTIIELLKRYSFLCSSDTEVPLQLQSFGIVMRPKNGIYLKVVARSSNPTL